MEGSVKECNKFKHTLVGLHDDPDLGADAAVDEL